MESDSSKTGMDRRISVEFTNIKFCENLFSDSRVLTCGQTLGQTHGEENKLDFTTSCCEHTIISNTASGKRIQSIDHNKTHN